MAISKRTYPSTKLEVLDGNLISATSLPEDVVLILGKAYKGPTGAVFNVTSTVDATAAYGSTSPIIKQMQMAFAAGAQNVALYRVGGRAASIENIFGLGTDITTVEASSSADLALKVYIGPEPLTPNKDAVIVYRNDKIVYSSIATSTVNLGYLTVTGFDRTNNELYVGSYYDPVPFREVVQETGKRIIVTAVDTKTVILPDYDATKASKYGFTVLVDGRRTTKFTAGIGLDPLEPTKYAVVIDDAVVAGKVAYTVEVSYIVKLKAIELEDAELAYKEGEDLINASWKKYYEAFDQALTDLYIPISRSVSIGDLFNVPNIVDGSTVTDKLDYLLVEEDEWGERSYEWSNHKYVYQKNTTETTTDPEEADISSNGEPIVLKRFNEVDFAHRAGMWALTKTTEEGFFPNIVVGAIGPKVYNTKYINQWIGKAPTYNAAGQIIANGSGLLGHRLMVGSVDFAGGYYATDTGFPDGQVLLDSGNTVIDLGKYLSVVAAQSVLTTESTIKVSDIGSGAATYAGIIGSIIPGDGTTNLLVNGIYNAIAFKADRLKELNSAGYVAFVEKTKGLSVLRGSLATRTNSDFQFVGTSVVMNLCGKDIVDTCDPYIGKGIDGVLMVNLHTALHKLFAERQQAGWFTSYTIKLSQIGPNALLVRYKIKAKDELSEVSNIISLEREVSTEVIE